MATAAVATFACPQCGRKLKWTPAIAGKSGRCSCGAAFRAPDSVSAPEAVEGHYELALPPLPTPVAAVAVPPPLPAAIPSAAAPGVVGYQSMPSLPEDSSALMPLNVVHDIYIPAGVLAAGLIAVIAILPYSGHFTGGAVLRTMTLCGVAMVVKSLILLAIASSMAGSMGGSLGNPLAFALKVAALVVVLDAASLWCWNAMVALGVITANGHFYVVKTFMVMFLATLVVAALIVQFVYGLHAEEANIFSQTVAVGNLILNVILLIGAVVVVNAVRQAKVAAARAAAVVAQQTSSPQVLIPQSVNQRVRSTWLLPVAAQPASAYMNLDQRIAREIARGEPFIAEGRDWKKTTIILSSDKPICALIDHLYDAGAQKVWIDRVGMFGDSDRQPHLSAFVELPLDHDQRMKIIGVAHEYQKAAGIEVTPGDDSGVGKYLVIKVKRFGRE